MSYFSTTIAPSLSSLFSTTKISPSLSCLPQSKEDFLIRNEENVKDLNYVGMYITMIICFVVIVLYIWYVHSETQFKIEALWIEFQNGGFLIIIPIYYFVLNLSRIIIKHKVDAYKKEKAKC
jgi:hypothetical protein